VADRIVGAVAAEHGTPADVVVFVQRGEIPRTTSGKIRRGECRALYGRGELVEVHRHVTGQST
jgi:acyl-CoA synthetase (AMP-forming)/AMP-acid ligase II